MSTVNKIPEAPPIIWEPQPNHPEALLGRLGTIAMYRIAPSHIPGREGLVGLRTPHWNYLHTSVESAQQHAEEAWKNHWEMLHATLPPEGEPS